jgi:uncharacterized membrane protein YhhN
MGRFAGTAPVIITIIVLAGFGAISFLAMKPELAGVKESVVLYLLGAWQSMATAAAQYWLGSSNSSSKKDDQMAKKDETINTMVTGRVP